MDDPSIRKTMKENLPTTDMHDGAAVATKTVDATEAPD